MYNGGYAHYTCPSRAYHVIIGFTLLAEEFSHVVQTGGHVRVLVAMNLPFDLQTSVRDGPDTHFPVWGCSDSCPYRDVAHGVHLYSQWYGTWT